MPQETTLLTEPEPVVLGRTEPRLWTPPLRELTPETSYGFDVIDFARDVLGTPLDPWEEWLVIHAGELLPDGRPRFRKVLVVVARQNGKTFLCIVLTLYWLFVEQWPMVLSTSTNRDYAKESWRQAVDIAQANEYLSPEIPKDGVKQALGEECLTIEIPKNGEIPKRRCRYKIAASNRKGGRSLAIDRLILDELREHHTYEAWNASTKATNARPNAQIWMITNQGDDESVVLNAQRGAALGYLETGHGDKRFGLFEWSAPDESDPTDVQALAMANPNLGYRIDLDSLMGDAITAKAAGGEELAGYLTEVLCMKVNLLDPAIPFGLWEATATKTPVNLAEHRQSVALCLDVSPDMQHATLASAAVLDGKVHVEIVQAWDDIRTMKRELPGLVAKAKARTLGWFPGGPAAAVAAELTERKGAVQWPPRGTTLQELRTESAAVCMGMAQLIAGGEVAHPEDDLLDAAVRAARKGRRGDVWIYVRDKGQSVDPLYAISGAAHLARTLPPGKPPLVVLRS